MVKNTEATIKRTTNAAAKGIRMRPNLRLIQRPSSLAKPSRIGITIDAAHIASSKGHRKTH